MLEVVRSANISAFASVRGDDALLIGFSFHHELRDGLGQLGRLDREQNFPFSIVDLSCIMRFPYPIDEVSGALAAVGTFAKGFRRVVTFGGSLAGFLAINFAPQLGADVAIAGSPPFTLDPQKMPHEKRWEKYQGSISRYPWDDIGKGLARLRETYVIYDPTGRDAKHAEAIGQMSDRVRLMPLRYGSHPATLVLQERATLARILTAVVEGTLTDADFRQAIVESRPRSPFYLRKLAAGQPASRRALKIRLLEMALKLDPSVAAFLDMLPVLARMDRLCDARALAQPVSDLLAQNALEIRTLKKENAVLAHQLAKLTLELESLKSGH